MGTLFVILGGYLGVLIDARFLGGSDEKLNDNLSICKIIPRIIVTTIIIGPPLLLYILLSYNLKLINLVLFKSILPFFVSGMSMFTVLRLVL